MTARLKVDFCAGETIHRAVQEMVDLSARIGVRVETNFNGVHISVREVSNVAEVVDRFFEEVGSEKKHKMVIA